VQQFVVPQFIDVEDKIFGPITTRQFIILLIAGGIMFLAYRFGDLALFGLVTAVVGGLALVFAFGKVNGQLFHYFLLNIFQTLRKPGMRIWRKDYSVEELNYLRKMETEAPPPPAAKKAVRRRHIRDLALIVNTGGYYQGED
jgi:hypothetical protein